MSENLVVTRLFRRVALTIVMAIVLGLVGCGTVTPWTIAARSPQVHVDVSAGCPMSLNDWQDVRNTAKGLGSELVPPNPVAALICRYHGAPGTWSVLAFAYPERQDVDLWYADSGCPILDNGQIAAWELGNPPFYQGFAALVDQLAPPE